MRFAPRRFHPQDDPGGRCASKAPAAPGKTTGLSKPSLEIAETPKNQSSITTPFSVREVASPVGRLCCHRGAVVSRHQTR